MFFILGLRGSLSNGRCGVCIYKFTFESHDWWLGTMPIAGFAYATCPQSQVGLSL
ncbi:hypothetical protein PN499_16055 [Kamptonema animale CS-326]|uniref:hypothetical protein n=1 Tax=Kamptonema animale TaxID=92934 RepID=UPI00232E4224|nr:hypothetical protein [Kamptonema animale]MDB9512703.1 hypothetical protein [Kamptonema animale CS-326]